jgi:hypothetical protein
MVFLNTMLTTADVNIHALITKYGIDIQIVRPAMTQFKMFRVKVNMDFIIAATIDLFHINLFLL